MSTRLTPTQHSKIPSGARVILLCGISGSGKTCVAHSLEAEGFRRIASDRLAWERYGGNFTSQPWERQQELFAAVRSDIDAEIARSLEAGERIVVDATNCKRARRDALRRLCRSFDVEPVLVFLPGTYDILSRRLSGRQGLGPDDIIITDSQLRGFLEGFEPPTPDENAIEIL